jgi:hypothetical protein
MKNKGMGTISLRGVGIGRPSETMQSTSNPDEIAYGASHRTGRGRHDKQNNLFFTQRKSRAK